jgi:hypothetical protein
MTTGGRGCSRRSGTPLGAYGTEGRRWDPGSAPRWSFGDTPLQKAESATLAGRLNGMKVASEMTPYHGSFLPLGPP